MPGLTLNFLLDAYGDPHVVAEAESAKFRGCAKYWMSVENFRQLSESLAAGPLDRAKPIEETWYGERLTLRLEAIDTAGHLRAMIEIGKFMDEWSMVRCNFAVTYAGLDRFRSGLEAALRHGEGRAVLPGDDDWP